VWDVKNLSKPLANVNIDLGNGIYEPFYDEDMNLMQLVAMGDTTIRYYEFTNDAPFAHFCTDNKLLAPTLGIARLPKKICDVADVEFAQFLKISPVSNSQTVERFSAKIPRTKSEFFQDDIFVPTRGTDSVLTADQWFSGKNGVPKLVSLQPAGMKLLSEAPKVERMVKKYNPGEVKQDAQDLKNAVVNRFYDQMLGYKEEENQVAPQNQNEGVEENEWSD